MASSANDYAQIYKDIQKIASDSQIQIQKLSNESTAKSFEYNSKEAQKTRTWETNMSNTSHQREVKDLIKAGLNPVLSANQGANAYTTNSAHAQAENASQAVATLAGQRIGSMANLTGSKMGADATRNAAAVSAAATREAARQSAAAQRYAADAAKYNAQLNYEAAIYRANKDYEAKIYQVDHQKVNSIIGLVDKFTDNLGLQKGLKQGIESIWKAKLRTKSFTDDVAQTIAKYTSSHVLTYSKNVFSVLNKTLTELSLEKNAYNRNLVFKGWILNDKKAQQQMFNLAKYANSPHNVNLGRAYMRMKW